MTPRQVTAFRIEKELLDGLQRVAERQGIPVSEQVRRAIKGWLAERGVQVAKPRHRSFEQNVQRAVRKWDAFIDRLEAHLSTAKVGEVPVPDGLHLLVTGAQLRDLTDEEYKLLVGVGADLGKSTDVLKRAWRAVDKMERS